MVTEMAKLTLTSTDASVFQQQFTRDDLDSIIETDVDLGFVIPFDWQIESMYNYFATWLVTESESPTASVVGVVSSAKFCSIISQFVDLSLAKTFNLLIYSASVLYNRQKSIEEQYSAEILTKAIA